MRFRVVLLERDGMGRAGGRQTFWRWRLISGGNNKILAHSELYSAKHDAVRTAEALADALGVIVETDVH